MPGREDRVEREQGDLHAGAQPTPIRESSEPPGARRLVSGARACGPTTRRGQCEQPFGAPPSSAVRKLEPQPQAATAFGLLTVKPAPMSVST